MGLGAAILVVIFPSAYRVVGSFGYQIYCLAWQEHNGQYLVLE
jgi:hypothetical protein